MTDNDPAAPYDIAAARAMELYDPEIGAFGFRVELFRALDALEAAQKALALSEFASRQQSELYIKLGSRYMELEKRVDSIIAQGREIIGEADARAEAAEAEVERLRAEIDVTDQLLTGRNRLLALFDCPEHGPCVPFAMDEVERLREENASLRSEVERLRQSVWGKGKGEQP